MSALTQAQERIDKTNELIRSWEATLAGTGEAAPPSVLFTIKSLKKLRDKLERELRDIADIEAARKILRGEE